MNNIVTQNTDGISEVLAESFEIFQYQTLGTKKKVLFLFTWTNWIVSKLFKEKSSLKTLYDSAKSIQHTTCAQSEKINKKIHSTDVQKIQGTSK